MRIQPNMGATAAQSSSTSALEALMLEAYDKGDMDTVMHALDQGANVDARRADSDNRTLLEKACVKEDLEFVLHLVIDRGADVNANGGPLPALHEACANNFIEIVDRLLLAGAEVELVGIDEQMTPLQAAAETGAADAIEVLLRNGADVWSGHNELDEAPLDIALIGGHALAFVTLYEACFLPVMGDEQFHSPFEYAWYGEQDALMAARILLETDLPVDELDAQRLLLDYLDQDGDLLDNPIPSLAMLRALKRRGVLTLAWVATVQVNTPEAIQRRREVIEQVFWLIPSPTVRAGECSRIPKIAFSRMP